MRQRKIYAKNSSLWRGVSVTELAIVLGVIGVLLVSIWVYIGQNSKTVARQQLSQEITTVVAGTRALYAGSASILGGITVLTPSLINQNAIPSTMVRHGSGCTNTPMGLPSNLCADTPWGSKGNVGAGTFGVCAWTAGPKTDATCATTPTTATIFFAIEISAINLDDCISIATRNARTTGGATGLLDVAINGKSALKPAGNPPLPVTMAFATANCAASSTIDFVYQLRAPTL